MAASKHGQISVSDILARIEDEAVRAVTLAILESSLEIAALLRDGGSDNSDIQGGTNAFGDAQLQIDVKSDEAIRDRLRQTGYVKMCSSEEVPEGTILSDAPGAQLSVGYDPLDGSSVVGSNFAVGSIFGVWKTPYIVGACGTDVVLGAATVYGPRTVVYLGGSALSGSGVYEVNLSSKVAVSKCMGRKTGTIEDGKGKLFAPANLRASADLEGYKTLIDWYMQQRYTLRYTGAMVPDVTQMLVKGYGVFMSPVSAKAKAKLRLVYEAIPMAVLVEAAGGASSDGRVPLTERLVMEYEERTAVCVGSAAEVKRFTEMCGSV